MTRDFAKQRRTPQKKPRQNSNRRTANKKTQTSIPAWIWLVVGMCLGALLMLLFHSAVMQPRQPSAGHAAPPAGKTRQPQPRFDFYQLLKDQEVIVSETAPEMANKPPQDMFYLLQAGSFRNNADADRLRAQLLLLNLSATIETVKAHNGDRWHRVIVGPFKSRSKLAKARSVLAGHQIDSLLLKRQ